MTGAGRQAEALVKGLGRSPGDREGARGGSAEPLDRHDMGGNLHIRSVDLLLLAILQAIESNCSGAQAGEDPEVQVHRIPKRNSVGAGSVDAWRSRETNTAT
jgi:hypothetical protein